MTTRDDLGPVIIGEGERDVLDPDRLEPNREAAQPPPPPPPPQPPQPPAAPSPETTQGFVDRSKFIGPDAAIRQDLLPDVEASLYLHSAIGPVDFSGAVPLLADKFLEVTGNDPTIAGRLADELQLLMALSDTEIADRIANGEPISEFGDIYDAITDIVWEVGATEVAAKMVLESADAIRGTFEALTTTGIPGDPAQVGAHNFTDDSGNTFTIAGANLTPEQAFAARTYEEAKGIRDGVYGVFVNSPGSWAFDPDQNILAVTLDTPDGLRHLGVRPRPGFNPQDHLDVLIELMAGYTNDEARLERELAVRPFNLLAPLYDMGIFLDTHPGIRDTVDDLWNLGNELLLFAPLNPARTFKDPLALAEANIENELEEAKVNIVPPAFPSAQFQASIAQQALEAPGGENMSKSTLLGIAAGIVAENRAEFEAGWEEMTRAELIQDVEARFEDRSALGEFIDETLANVFDVFMWWENITQTIALNLIQFGINPLLALGEVEDGKFTEEGLRLLKDAITIDSGFENWVGDYYQLEGDMYDTANIVSSIFFDPINWAFPGARGVKAMFRRAMTDPKYAGWVLRSRSYRNVINSIAKVNMLDEVAGTVVPPTTTQINRAITNVLYLDNLTDDGFVRLIALAQDPHATVEAVEEVLRAEMANGFFLGAGHSRAIRTSTVEGMGRMLESAVSQTGLMSNDQIGRLMEMVAQFSRTRQFNLGENIALSNWFDILHQFYIRDPDKLVELAVKAANAVSEAGPTRRTIQGTLTATKQRARKDMTAASVRHRKSPTDVGGIRENINAVNTALVSLDDLGVDAAARVALERDLRAMRINLERQLRQAEPRAAERDALRRQAHKSLASATRTQADLATDPSRTALAHVIYEFYDDLARDLNKEAGEEIVPKIMDGKTARPNPWAPHVPMRDWSQVIGAKGSPKTQEELLRIAGFALDDSSARELTAAGMFSRTENIILPASPYEVMLYRRLLQNRPALKQFQEIRRRRWIGRRLGDIKLAFGVNLLMNPITAGKVTLDETFRFLASEGITREFFGASVAGLPGDPVGRLMRATRSRLQKVPGFGHKVSDDFGEWVTNPWAQQYARGHQGFIGNEVYEWVPQNAPGVSKREWLASAERWVNGTLLNDPLFRHYARFIDDAIPGPGGVHAPPKGFVEWWVNGGPGGDKPGWMLARANTFTVGEATFKGSSREAAVHVWETLDRSFILWTEKMVKEGSVNKLKRRLLQAAAGHADPLSVTGTDAGLLRAIKEVPAPIREGNPSLVTRGFDAFFGGPSARRGGVMFQKFYDDAMSIYKERFAGRVISAEGVQKEAASKLGITMTIGEARSIVREGANNAIVRRLISNGGVTERQLQAHAARYAQIRADDLMFRFTATSFAGQGIEAGLLFPFARAQVDFLGWWSRHLTTLPRVRGNLQDLPFIGKGFEVLDEAFQQFPVPVNIKAMAQYAHINAAVNNDQPSLFDQAIDQLTFFPTNWSTEFLLDVLPQPGPVPAWQIQQGINSGWVDDSVLSTLESLWPSIGYAEGTQNLFDMVIPSSRRSVRGGLAAIAGLVGQPTHSPDAEAFTEDLYQFLSAGRTPPAMGDFTTEGVAEWLRDNAFDIVPGTSEAHAAMSDIAISAAFDANGENAWQALKDRGWPFADYNRLYRSLKSFAPMFSDESWTLLNHFGVLDSADLRDENGTPRLQAAWVRFQNGEADEADKEYLSDSLYRLFNAAGEVTLAEHPDHGPIFTLKDYLLINGPEMAVNLVTKSGCSEQPIRTDAHRQFHDTHCDAQTGRIQNIAPGPQGDDDLADARRRGWVAFRPADGLNGWGQDAHEAVFSASRGAVGAAWYWVTGRTWAQGLKKSIADQDITITQAVHDVLAPTGLDLEVGTSMTVEEYHGVLSDHRTRFAILNGPQRALISSGPVVQLLTPHDDYYGRGLLDDLKEAADIFSDQGIHRIEEWPESAKENVRGRIREAVTLGYLAIADYNQQWQELFGPLDYEPPDPPPVDQLKASLEVTPEQARDGTFEVVDGDTVAILLADGPTRIRIIGINAPEVGQEGASEATQNLLALIAAAETIHIGFYKPELFGITQRTAPGEERFLAFLYVNGVPIYDPSVFTSDNPRGASVGGSVLDLQGILDAGDTE